MEQQTTTQSAAPFLPLQQALATAPILPRLDSVESSFSPLLLSSASGDLGLGSWGSTSSAAGLPGTSLCLPSGLSISSLPLPAITAFPVPPPLDHPLLSACDTLPALQKLLLLQQKELELSSLGCNPTGLRSLGMTLGDAATLNSLMNGGNGAAGLLACPIPGMAAEDGILAATVQLKALQAREAQLQAQVQWLNDQKGTLGKQQQLHASESGEAKTNPVSKPAVSALTPKDPSAKKQQNLEASVLLPPPQLNPLALSKGKSRTGKALPTIINQDYFHAAVAAQLMEDMRKKKDRKPKRGAGAPSKVASRRSPLQNQGVEIALKKRVAERDTTGSSPLGSAGGPHTLDNRGAALDTGLSIGDSKSICTATGPGTGASVAEPSLQEGHELLGAARYAGVSPRDNSHTTSTQAGAVSTALSESSRMLTCGAQRGSSVSYGEQSKTSSAFSKEEGTLLQQGSKRKGFAVSNERGSTRDSQVEESSSPAHVPPCFGSTKKMQVVSFLLAEKEGNEPPPKRNKDIDAFDLELKL